MDEKGMVFVDEVKGSQPALLFLPIIAALFVFFLMLDVELVYLIGCGVLFVGVFLTYTHAHGIYLYRDRVCWGSAVKLKVVHLEDVSHCSIRIPLPDWPFATLQTRDGEFQVDAGYNLSEAKVLAFAKHMETLLGPEKVTFES